MNDLTLLIFAFLLGTLLGVIATLSIYGTINNKLTEGERQETEEALKKAQDERDEALARIDAYLEDEKRQHLDMEQPGGEETPARRAAAAPPKRTDLAAAPPPELLPAPREELTDATKSATSLGFGPPRQYGKN
jgi:hypothetical protein